MSFGLEFRITQRNITEDLNPQINLLGIIGRDFDEIYHLLGKISCIRQTHDNKWEYAEIVYQLLADFKKAYDIVTNGILHNILAGFIAPKKSQGTYEAFKLNLQ
jgi:hypothetical protein